MPSRPYYRWFPSDYLVDTLALTETQDLIYRRMLDAMWINGGLPEGEKDAARIVRVDVRRYRRAMAEALHQHTEIIEGKVWNSRLHKEFKAHELRVANGKRGGNKRWHPEDEE